MTPFVTMHDARGRPLLAWGADPLVAQAGVLGYRLLVLTSDSQHPQLVLPGVTIKRGCWYLDSAESSAVALMKQKVLECAPGIAAQVRAGVPTLITCWLGESRSAVMMARVLYLLTGKSGLSIIQLMEAARGDGMHAPKNSAFRSWVASWPAVARPKLSWALVAAGAVLAGIGAYFALRKR